MWWPFAIGWLGTAIGVFLSYLSAGLIAAGLTYSGAIDAEQDSSLVGAAVFLLGTALTVVSYFVAFAPYRAAAMNQIASQITIDGARFKLRAKTLSLLFYEMLGWIFLIFSLGLLAPVAGFLQVRYILNRLELIDMARFAEIGQSVLRDSDAGESLGDAFDLDMGVGVI